MKRTLLVLTLALSLLIPASFAFAGASLPKAPDPTIEVSTSLGGIKIGQPEAKAKAAWGAGRGSCKGSGDSEEFTYCEYGESGSSVGYARFEARNGKVTAAQINAGISQTNGQTTSAGAGLLAFKTPEGIGIGSKYAALKQAYPKGELVGKPSDEVFYYVFRGKAKHSMTFSLVAPGKKVFQVVISDGKGG